MALRVTMVRYTRESREGNLEGSNEGFGRDV
jgi:hypothetical protein